MSSSELHLFLMKYTYSLKIVQRIIPRSVLRAVRVDRKGNKWVKQDKSYRRNEILKDVEMTSGSSNSKKTGQRNWYCDEQNS